MIALAPPKELKDVTFLSVGVADLFVELRDCVDGVRRSLAGAAPGDTIARLFIITGDDGGRGVAEAVFKERRSMVADSDVEGSLFVDLGRGKDGAA